ncbi:MULTISPECIES: hypothetical protein [unclassified Streptomyces]|uniref:hypothetical protein n=1 Tax=unclassified Streptomyces TaxID=2593676 RepID=UPI0011CE8B0C|nr:MULTISPECIES: hypothetical protein [unclassified Streptomyces]
MAAVSPRPDSARPAQEASDVPAAPQHSDLFLQPQYTVDLPPLDEDEDTYAPPAERRGGAIRNR